MKSVQDRGNIRLITLQETPSNSSPVDTSTSTSDRLYRTILRALWPVLLAVSAVPASHQASEASAAINLVILPPYYCPRSQLQAYFWVFRQCKRLNENAWILRRSSHKEERVCRHLNLKTQPYFQIQPNLALTLNTFEINLNYLLRLTEIFDVSATKLDVKPQLRNFWKLCNYLTIISQRSKC